MVDCFNGILNKENNLVQSQGECSEFKTYATKNIENPSYIQ